MDSYDGMQHDTRCPTRCSIGRRGKYSSQCCSRSCGARRFCCPSCVAGDAFRERRRATRERTPAADGLQRAAAAAAPAASEQCARAAIIAICSACASTPATADCLIQPGAAARRSLQSLHLACTSGCHRMLPSADCASAPAHTKHAISLEAYTLQWHSLCSRCKPGRICTAASHTAVRRTIGQRGPRAAAPAGCRVSGRRPTAGLCWPKGAGVHGECGSAFPAAAPAAATALQHGRLVPGVRTLQIPTVNDKQTSCRARAIVLLHILSPGFILELLTPECTSAGGWPAWWPAGQLWRAASTAAAAAAAGAAASHAAARTHSGRARELGWWRWPVSNGRTSSIARCTIFHDPC
jgi:hypothetical protein